MRKIFFIDTKENWDRVRDAVDTFRRKRDAGGRALYKRRSEDEKTLARMLQEKMIAEIISALEPVRISEQSFCHEIVKLCMANNFDRALILINKTRVDRQLRWGWSLILNITLLPFRIIFGIVKIILP